MFNTIKAYVALVECNRSFLVFGRLRRWQHGQVRVWNRDGEVVA